MGRTKKNETAKTVTKAKTKPETTVEEADVETTPAIVEEKAPTAPITVTLEEAQEMVRKAVAEAMAASKAQQGIDPADVPSKEDNRVVRFLFMAEVSDENEFFVGEGGFYGRIVGKTGTFWVPKAELSRVMDGMFRLLLRRRWIIVVSGLTDEEREAYGVNYKEGEVLDELAFSRMVEIEDKILDIYPRLCAGHRKMVAKRYNDAWNDKNPHVRRDVVVALNQMSKELDGGDGDFRAIVDAMNAEGMDA